MEINSQTHFLLNHTLTSIKFNEDIITEIILRLPLKHLLKSRSVCKWWNHLISNPTFIARYSLRNPDSRVSGLLVQRSVLGRMNSSLRFIDYNDSAMYKFSISFIEDEHGVFIQDSNNGLLLCSSFRCHGNERIYYICQPETKQYYTLPQPDSEFVYGINIAFNPFKSSFIRIVCVVKSEVLRYHYQVKIYTSDENVWRDSGKPFIRSDILLFNRGVFWNGGLHWVSRKMDSSLRFDVEQELLLEMPMPEILEGKAENGRRLGYFGVSGEYLYMVHIYGARTNVFDVMEMKSDYSGWFVKYHVDLSGVAIHYSIPMDRFLFSIMHLDHQWRRRSIREVEVEQEEIPEEELCLMLQFHIPGKLISYDLENMTFLELNDLSGDFLSSELHLQSEYSWETVYSYINTLCYI